MCVRGGERKRRIEFSQRRVYICHGQEGTSAPVVRGSHGVLGAQEAT